MSSRGIPDVRPWRVRCWQGDKVTHETIVHTINVRFAKWLAAERFGRDVWLAAERITVLSLRGSRQASASRVRQEQRIKRLTEAYTND